VAVTLPRAHTLGRLRPWRAAVGGWRSGELPWLGAAAGVMVVLCALPYVVASLVGPNDLERIGTFWFVKDFSQYAAAMREGARQPGWLIHDHFSAEPHHAAFVYPLYVGMGKLAATVRVDPLVVFGLAEWLGRLTLVGAIYAFAAEFVRDRRARQLALILAAGSLGVAALASPWQHEINVYLELSSFGVFLSAPHLMLGLALTLMCGVLYLRRRLVWLAAAMVALTLVHPFNVPVLLSVLVLHALWSGRAWWAAAAVAVTAATPVVLYNAYLFTTDPFWRGTYGIQNEMPAPAPWSLPLDFGIVLLVAPLAWPIVKTWPAERRRLVLLWVGLALLWLYAPVPYQRRFAFGVQPALAVLAAVGLLWASERVRSRWFNYGLVSLTALTPVLVYVALIGSAASNFPAEVYLWSRAEAEAGRWIGEHSSADDVVLASTELANPLVGTIDGRVVHGHIVATLNSDAKKALLQRFYSPDASQAERNQILQESDASIVVLGPRERALGAQTLAQQQPQLELVYDRAGVQVFRVTR
jgi:hypothetical protein